MQDDGNMKSSILGDLFRYVPQMMIPALIAFISVPVFTSLFNPSAYGDFNIVRVSNSLLERGSSWVGCSLARYYNDYLQGNKLSLVITTILKLNFVIGTLVLLLALVLLPLLGITPELKTLFEVGLMLFVLQLFYNTLSNVLRMSRKINIQSVFILISTLLSFAISLVLVMVFGMKIVSILMGNLVVTLLLLPFLWRKTISGMFRMGQPLDMKLVKKFAGYGVPLTISGMGIWILDLSDRYIIKIMLNSHEVGVYSACYNVVWNSLFLIVNAFFMMEEPLAMKIFAKDGKERLATFIRCETRLFLMLITPVTLLVCCYSKPLLSIMVASKYLAGAAIVPYVAVSVVVVGLVYKYNLGFLAMEKTKNLMHIMLSAGASNVVFNLFLIPRIGILGAGIATLLSYLLYLVLVVVSARNAFVWKFPSLSLLRVTAAAALSVYGPAIFVRTASVSQQVATMAASVIVYLVMLRLFNEIDREEFNMAVASVKTWSRKAYALTGR